MTSDIFTRADYLVAQSNGDLTRSEALAELQRRSVLARRAKYGMMRIRDKDRSAFENIEKPKTYWWNEI